MKTLLALLLLLVCSCGENPTGQLISGTYGFEGSVEGSELDATDSFRIGQIWLSIPSSPLTDASRIRIYLERYIVLESNQTVPVPWITGHKAGQQCGGEAMQPMALIIDAIDSSSFRAHATWEDCFKCGLLCVLSEGPSELTLEGQSVAGVMYVHMDYDGATVNRTLFPVQNDTPRIIECPSELPMYCF